MAENINLKVNGSNKSLQVDPEEPLLYILREEYKLNGPKFGCGLQQCGACMVLADGEAQPTCLQPCKSFEGKEIKTLESLATDGKLNPVQQAFVEVQAAQCGFCLNGMVISAVALLDKTPSPSDDEIRQALDQVICRCGTHSRFFKAVKLAVQKI